MTNLSIVSSLYNSEKYIKQFIAKTEKALKSLKISRYEIILVDDGSPDNSFKIACNIAAKNSKIIIVKLSRNYGQPNAFTAGLAESKGDKVFLIDSDLEEDPGWLELFYNEMLKGNQDCIYGLQTMRKGNFFEKISGRIFYKLLNLFSDIRLVPNQVTSRIMTRRYVDSFLKFKERNLSIGMLCTLNGFPQKGIFINKKNSSPSSYSLFKKLRLGISVILFMSSKPLEIIVVSGLFLCLSSFIGGLILLYLYFTGNGIVPGWTSILLSIVLFPA